jgi:hypothetical protein
MKFCKICGDILDNNSEKNNLCNTCADKTAEDYYKIKDFLQKNSRATIFEISRSTGVQEHRVLEFINQGRLVGSEHSGASKKCIICGNSIKHGTLCSKCDVSKFS